MTQMTLKEIEARFLENRDKYPFIKLVSQSYGTMLKVSNNKARLTYSYRRQCCFIGFVELDSIGFGDITHRTESFRFGFTFAFDGYIYPIGKVFLNKKEEKEYISGYRFGKRMRDKYLSKE